MQREQDASGEPRRHSRTAYVIGTFPSLTTTFIEREVLEVKRCGLELILLALRRPPPYDMRPEVEQLAAETTYLLPISRRALLADHLRFAAQRPAAYWSTLRYLLTRRHRSARARWMTFLHFGMAVRAAGLLQAKRVTHVHAHFADRATTVALVASRLLGIRYSLTAHANDIYASPVLLPEKVAHAKFVVTCTRYNQAYLQRLGGRAIELVYHGLDLSTIPAVRSPVTAGLEPLILSVGQLKVKKGFHHLIQASRLLKDQGYKFRCEIIGEGPTRAQLEAQIAELGLEREVVLCGARPNAEVMTRYSQASLFVLPAVPAPNGDQDGIPNVLLEALALGVPVISTRHSGIPEVVQDGVTGLLVEPGDVPALALAMARLLCNPTLCERLAQQGRSFVEAQFDIRKNTQCLVGLLTG